MGSCIKSESFDDGVVKSKPSNQDGYLRKTGPSLVSNCFGSQLIQPAIDSRLTTVAERFYYPR